MSKVFSTISRHSKSLLDICSQAESPTNPSVELKQFTAVFTKPIGDVFFFDKAPLKISIFQSQDKTLPRTRPQLCRGINTPYCGYIVTLSNKIKWLGNHPEGLYRNPTPNLLTRA
jgi:hypothetical protein